jgi:hypothetical protein
MKIVIYKSNILSIVLYEHEACPFSERRTSRQRVFKIWVLRRILGPRKKEVIRLET